MVEQTTFNRTGSGSSPDGSTNSNTEIYTMTIGEKLMAILYCTWMAIPSLIMLVAIELLRD